MWPFKKKEEALDKKNTWIKLKILKFHPSQQFNVGKTTIKVTLLDGRKFDFTVYGSVYQHQVKEIKGYIGFENAKVSDVRVIPSTEEASLRITFAYDGRNSIFSDFPSPNATKSILGIPIAFNVIKTEDHYVYFQTAYTEERHITLEEASKLASYELEIPTLRVI